MKSFTITTTSKKTKQVKTQVVQAETYYDLFLDQMSNYDDEYSSEKISDYSESAFNNINDVCSVIGCFFDDDLIEIKS
tara:strand:- start:295 stop:528 length:234 start_codon:yes stop_codon:yes gene_type:complete